MKHIAIFDNMADVQTALNDEVLVKPYVALVSGALDYNTMEPEEPCSLGEWSDDGEGTYTFTFNPEDEGWDGGSSYDIGTLDGVYYQGQQMDMNVVFSKNNLAGWQIEFTYEDASENPAQTFDEGNPDTWNSSGAMTDPHDSYAVINVSWNGTDTFVFNSGDDLHPLSMTTYSPCE